MQLSRRAGQKEARFAHLLSGPVADEHRDAVPASVARADAGDDRIAALEGTIAELRGELADLRARFEEFTRQFG